jgi:DNA repair protein SbcD/Mre11
VRGAVLLTLHADGTLERETHPVATTAVRDLTVDLTGIEHTGQVQARVREALHGFEGYARITLEGELPPQVTLRRSELDALTVPGVTQPVVRVGRITEALDLEALRNEATVRGAFVNRVLSLPDSDHDETLRRRILLTGLRALEGRGEDLEVL